MQIAPLLKFIGEKVIQCSKSKKRRWKWSFDPRRDALICRVIEMKCWFLRIYI